MRKLPALTLMLFCLVLRAQAQRGGAARAGTGAPGGGVVHGGLNAAAPHIGFGAPFRTVGTPYSTGYGTLRPGMGASGLRSVPRAFGYGTSVPAFSSPGLFGPVIPGQRPGANHILRGPGRPPGRLPEGNRGRGVSGYPGLVYGGLGFGYPAAFGFGYPITPFWDFGDSLGYDASPYTGFAGESYTGGAVGNDPYQAYGSYPPETQEPDPGQAVPGAPYQGAPADGSQPMVYAPYPYNYPSAPPQAPVVIPPAPLREEDALTLYFRDGRPPEQIRNYALTRTSLLITGDRMREIPLSDLDLAQTVRVNRAAGVDFQLPATP